MTETLNKIARAIGAFAFNLNGMRTQSVKKIAQFDFSGNEMSEQYRLTNAVGRWEQRWRSTKKCRYEGKRGYIC